MSEDGTREFLARLIIAMAGIIVWGVREGKDFKSVQEIGLLYWNKIKEGRWPE